MVGPFIREGEEFTSRLEPDEAGVLADLLRQVSEVLDPPPAPSTGDPFADLMAQVAPVREDWRHPALDRLVPNGHRDDPELAASYRAWTERPLREMKATRLRAAQEALAASDGLLRLDPAAAASLLGALTDVRLLLGERLGLRTAEDVDKLEERFAELTEDGPEDENESTEWAIAGVYEVLTWWQESLAEALLA